MALVSGRKLSELSEHTLIVAPHPDDEAFGCGGLIRTLIEEGKKVSVVILTQGEKSLQDYDKNEVIEARKKMTLDTASVLGVRDIFWAGMEDGNIRNSNPGQLYDIINKVNPHAVFIPHYQEGWSDHEAAEKIVLDFIRKRKQNIKCYHYCVWLWFSMPYSGFKKVKWKDARVLKMKESVYEKKLKTIEIYMNSKNREGKPYSGVLPHEFLYANSRKKELFFEINY